MPSTRRPRASPVTSRTDSTRASATEACGCRGASASAWRSPGRSCDAPALLVLDEATSALDDGTEEEVLDLLSSLRPEVTVLVVAHRHSTIAVADHVVQLD